MSKTINIGIITVSDRVSTGEYEDKSGQAISDWLGQTVRNDWQPIRRVVPEDRDLVELTLRELCDDQACHLVVTTGGAGPVRRDITPEATIAVCDKVLDGFGELMRSVLLRLTPMAIFYRPVAGIRGKSLIVNLPAEPAEITRCLAAVFPAIPYGIDLIEGYHLETNDAFSKAFRCEPNGAKPD